MQALYEAANDLPSDDPQRPAPNAPAAATARPGTAPNQPAGTRNSSAQTSNATSLPAQQPGQQTQPASHPPANTVVVADAGQLRVPSLLGLSVRQVIVAAANAGLEVEITGSGSAREQVPAAGAMVPPGTKIVVRCAR
jgi:cell division protein FtsI (penicillin-binding protein 3)